MLSVVGALYGQQTVDTVLAASFQPTEQVQSVADRTGLTVEGKRLFYASQAAIEDKQQFNKDCESTERSAAILGCYTNRKIYVYNVTNKDLDGAVEVTAAHEMLHAAYDRLNFFEKARIDSLIKNEYDKIRKDPVIAETMTYYQKQEPGEEVNELHSIIGTTVPTLSPALEKYYSQYFKDRATIVAMNVKYNTVFAEIQTRAEALQAEINTKGPILKQELSTYDADRAQLEIDIQSFNDRATSQGFSSQSSFTLSRNALIRRVNELNARRATINNEVNDYNSLIAQLNALSIKANEYNQSLNGVEAASGI